MALSEQQIADFFAEKILTAQKTVRDAFREVRTLHGVNISTIVQKIKKAIEEDEDGYSDNSGVPLPDKPEHKSTDTSYIKAVIDYVTRNGEFPTELDPDIKYLIVMLLSMIVAGRYWWCMYAYAPSTPVYSNEKDPQYTIGQGKLYCLAYDSFDKLMCEVQPGYEVAPTTGLDNSVEPVE